MAHTRCVGTLHVVTLVIDLPITKLDALDTVAFVADGEVEGAGSVSPRVWLSTDAWAQVEIPKFADPPPLAIDVFSETSREVALSHARRLAAALEEVGWTIRPERPVR
ncbi:hypothetical protein JNB61_12710 [Microbacterium ureisolvens]|uniref:Aspartyl-tRNA synthetase n=1 Tax=Microbacterium ureisolvens TaxID=2781186 RepID=A0ABS7HZ16_9MICO|nr:hypothetical protein [Microbacterium ureisolvens]